MKPATLLLIAFAGLAVAQEEPRLEKAPAEQVLRDSSKAPWLGLTVSRLEDAVRAHVPAIPAGFGFVIASVEPGSPAEKAGLKPYDVFWKLGDQWVANEAQLFALLRLHEAGDEVKLGIYRSGESLTLPVVLAPIPQDRLLGKLPPLESSVLPAAMPDLPMKVLKPADRSAEIETADGKAVLSLVDGNAEVKIASSDGTVVYEGPVSSSEGVSLVPDPWKPRVGALERALAHAMKGSLAPRAPRTRVVPPAEPIEK
jgi:PDZ domain